MYPEIKTILYATDLGDHMRPVFRFALGIAKKHGSKITMLHVAEPLGSGVLTAIGIYMPEVTVKELVRDGLQKALAEMQRRLDAFCEEELKENPADRQMVSDVKVMTGRPAEIITQQAEKLKADLIVVGTHTEPGAGAYLLGSTARKVTQLSKNPVLVVPVYE